MGKRTKRLVIGAAAGGLAALGIMATVPAQASALIYPQNVYINNDPRTPAGEEEVRAAKATAQEVCNRAAEESPDVESATAQVYEKNGSPELAGEHEGMYRVTFVCGDFKRTTDPQRTTDSRFRTG
jgi:hypothetical protein